MIQTILFFIVFIILGAFSVFGKRKKKTKLVAISVLAVALIFEIFVANFHSFHLLGGGYEQASLDFNSSDITVEGGTVTSEGKIESDSGKRLTVTASNINRPIGTLCFDCSASEPEEVADVYDISISASDETNAEMRGNVADGTVITLCERSQYVVLDMSGNVEKLRFTINSRNDEGFTLNSVSMNSSVPFRFSSLRLIFAFSAAMAAYALMSFPSMQKNYEDERKRYLEVSIYITVFAALGALVIAMICNGTDQPISGSGGNQISKELVDAFRAGQVSLLAKPSDELLAMDNPYDWSERIAKGIECLWDHLLFEGKYYSYYGIAPVLLLFLPFNLITGAYFSTFWAVMLFGILGIVFLTLTFNRFCDEYAKHIPVKMLIASLIVLQLCSGIWFCFCATQFYEIAQASGFMFTTAGFWLLLKSGVLGKEKIKNTFAALSAACFALAVLCRPTLALYCVTSLIAFAFGFFRRKRELSEGSKKTRVRQLTKLLACVIVPYALIGGIQMVYNYMRFGSFIDFGIQYSLTINDFTRSQYATDFVMIGFYNFLFAFPVIKPEFPYIFSNYSTLGVNGYYFTANRVAIGLPFRALPLFGIIGSGKALKMMRREEKLKALLFVLPTCIIIPLVIIFSIWESGYGVRYCCDFAWEMVLAGIGVLFFLYCRAYRDNDTMKKIIGGFFVFALFAAVAVNFSMIYEYMDANAKHEVLKVFYESMFDFWK